MIIYDDDMGMDKHPGNPHLSKPDQPNNPPRCGLTDLIEPVEREQK